MAKETSTRRGDSRLETPNLNRAVGDRHLIDMEVPVVHGQRESVLAFVTRYAALERLTPFGDPYTIGAVRLTWLDTVVFEKLLRADPELQALARKQHGKELWSPALAKQARAAVQRVFEEGYLPWLINKFDEARAQLCAEYTLVALGDRIRDRLSAEEWETFRKKHALPADYLSRPVKPMV